MDIYKFKIRCTYYYYGYPQAEKHYEVESRFLKLFLRHYGCQGFEIPETEGHKQFNGYFWELNAFLETFYGNYGKKLKYELFKMKEGDEYILTIDTNDKEHYKLEKVS